MEFWPHMLLLVIDIHVKVQVHVYLNINLCTCTCIFVYNIITKYVRNVNGHNVLVHVSYSIITLFPFLFYFPGVADGVGGWRNYGIDPAAFPRTLMNICERVVKEEHLNLKTPVKVIEASYEELLEQKTPLIGL